MKKRRIVSAAVIVLVILIIAGLFAAELKMETTAGEMSAEEAESFANEAFDKMAKNDVTKYIAEKNNIKVNDVSYGNERDVILSCSVNTIDVYSVVEPEYDKFLSSDVKKKNGTMFKSALDFKLEFNGDLLELVKTAPEKSVEAEIVLYDTKDGMVLYASDEAVNTVYGGVIDVKEDISARNTYKKINENGEVTEMPVKTDNVKKGFIECVSPVYDKNKPDTSGRLGVFINKQKKDFYLNFIDNNNWLSILKGLVVTLEITFVALLLGIFLGFLVAFVRCAYLKSKHHGVLLGFFNAVCKVYLTITRGTPVVVQILIIHFVILMPLGMSTFVSAVLCFGLNSGAYVSEIVRGGIMSVDDGQMEAGRSLGFSYLQTMWHIIFPQAFKAVLPALANEFVALLKETSIAFYIGLGDMMYSVNAIRSATYSPFMPLVASAIIYLILVMFFSKMVSLLERRLKNSER